MNSFLVGLQFLTRIRLRIQTEWNEEDFGKSVTWFPVIGWIIGAILCFIYFLMKSLGIPLLTGFILVAGELILTGALLADGLMDTADGLFSGRTKARCLEIMKDSLIGAFGLLAMLLLVLLKSLSLAVIEKDMYLLLFAMPTISRLNLVISICEYPYARPYGIGKSFAVYRSKHAVFIAFLTTLLPALFFGYIYLILMGVAILLGIYLNHWIVGKIGGTTGDTYGFVTEVTEAVLAFLFVILTKGGTWHI